MKGLLRQVDVCARLCISDETWRRWRAAGRTPKPADVPGALRWHEEDIANFGKPQPDRARQFFGSHRRAQRAPYPGESRAQGPAQTSRQFGHRDLAAAGIGKGE